MIFEIQGDEGRGPPRDDRAGEAGQQVHEVIDRIDSKETEQPARVVGQPWGVANEKNSEKAGGVEPGELSEHRNSLTDGQWSVYHRGSI